MSRRILVVGDFMSNKDVEEGGPWRDGIGRMFKGFLRQVGIEPRDCLFTNVFNFAPSPRCTLDQLLGPKTEGIPNVKPLKRGKYILARYKPDVEKFWAYVNHHQPNLILAAGDLALWATVAGQNSIDFARGRVSLPNSAIAGRKILPVYSPKQVVANWSMRPVLLADLEKAARECMFPEIRRPQRFIHIDPTLEEMEDFLNQYIIPSPYLSSDIETKGTVITCVGFSPSPERALVVPFYSKSAPGNNYWRTPREEKLAWNFVRRVLSLGKAVCGQNYQYDMQYEWREMGIPNPDFSDDTMLLHHVLQPELRKGLGFLASVYTDEIAWKGMHKVSSTDKTKKRGDEE